MEPNSDDISEVGKGKIQFVEYFNYTITDNSSLNDSQLVEVYDLETWLVDLLEKYDSILNCYRSLDETPVITIVFQLSQISFMNYNFP